jgi:hypothetical protein
LGGRASGQAGEHRDFQQQPVREVWQRRLGPDKALWEGHRMLRLI